jgi:TPR repeat protein
MRALALAHQFGRGTPVNQQRASSWWLSAAQGGDIQAMLITAANHEMGRGLPRSPIEADLWYARASYLMLPAPQDRALTLAE